MKNAAILLGLLAVMATGARAQQGHVASGAGAIPQGGPAKVRAEITLSPLLHIAFGSGPTAKDAINLSLNQTSHYENGRTWKVDRQLKVFSIGTGYAVDVHISKAFLLSEEEASNLYKILALGIFETGKEVTFEDVKNVSPVMKRRYTGGADGERELDVFYRIRLMADYNVQAFNYLASRDGGGKTYTIDLCYTIVPN